MNKKIFFSLFFLQNIVCDWRDKTNIIKNGHDIEEKDLEDLIGKSEEEIINNFGAPFILPGYNNILFYFVSKRQVHALFPITGENKKGLIIIITLDQNRNIKKVDTKCLKVYVSKNKIKERLKKVISEINNTTKKLKDLDQKYLNEEKERINALKAKKKTK